ncbi:hypothetical protein SJA_C1-21670 [Sphingobium indicum UT26S]|uniref:Uncharacterized protein n=1 Tax=Sphingobium indicum (strain DSM 16413 / CCM 7287 / MTCC 6362 / UT26 / NBRC 101211 / UT26S) TaxID=452662 RepID=D4Z319_SPHIU|nr:hypothetical protein SJA_C1-21670 [Sphingobium indicum UT26S]
MPLERRATYAAHPAPSSGLMRKKPGCRNKKKRGEGHEAPVPFHALENQRAWEHLLPVAALKSGALSPIKLRQPRRRLKKRTGALHRKAPQENP